MGGPGGTGRERQPRVRRGAGVHLARRRVGVGLWLVALIYLPLALGGVALLIALIASGPYPGDARAPLTAVIGACIALGLAPTLALIEEWQRARRRRADRSEPEMFRQAGLMSWPADDPTPHE